MSIWPDVIMTPLHVHGARTPEEYRAMQAKSIAQNRLRRPAMNWRDPVVVKAALPVFVSGGKWVVACPCGNAPSWHPDWRLACCFECGAIYEHALAPADATEIAAVLCARPFPCYRHWALTESVKDLKAENRAHGFRDAPAIPVEEEAP